MSYTVLFIIAIVITLGCDREYNKESDRQAKKWLTVILGYYILEFIMQMSQYHYVKKDLKENLCIMILRFIGMLFLVSWLIYGNVLYYQVMSTMYAENAL